MGILNKWYTYTTLVGTNGIIFKYYKYPMLTINQGLWAQIWCFLGLILSIRSFNQKDESTNMGVGSS